MERTLAVRLTEGEEAEIMVFCSKTRMTPREALLARARSSVPEVTAKDLERARHDAYMQGRAAACAELRRELAKTAEAVTRAQHFAEEYAEGVAWLGERRRCTASLSAAGRCTRAGHPRYDSHRARWSSRGTLTRQSGPMTPGVRGRQELVVCPCAEWMRQDAVAGGRLSVRSVSILWPEGRPVSQPIPQAPAYFGDLNLDQVVAGVASKDPGAELLGSVLCDHVRDVDTVRYRQEVFRDLGDGELLTHLYQFAQAMTQVESHLAQLAKMSFPYQRAAWFLDASTLYCDAVRALAANLDGASHTSRALAAFRAFVVPYASSRTFLTLVADTDARRASLAKIRYCVRIRGGRVEVTRYEGQADYSEEVLKTFERFKQGSTNDYRLLYRTGPGMDHIGGQILELVGRLFDDEFTALDHFCEAHAAFPDETVRRFHAELRFYLAYLAYVEPLRSAGLRFCLPAVSATSKEIAATETFDLALAHKLVSERKPVVTNDFHLAGAERTFLVSGPNQGGKTTFARTFGQLHHLAGVGCPVPGRQASLFLFNRLFTHFEREEDLATGTGKLESDLVRMRDILTAATSDSVIIMNETFTSSTMLKDARFLSRKVLEKVVQLDLVSVFVTFVDGLSDLSDSIVSMVSTIVPENPSERTFKVVRGPAGGLAYALAVAEKHGLTYDRLRRRLTV